MTARISSHVGRDSGVGAAVVSVPAALQGAIVLVDLSLAQVLLPLMIVYSLPGIMICVGVAAVEAWRGNADARIFVIGLGVLFATRLWWPGILFLAGLTAIVQGYCDPRRRSGIQGGTIAILVGIWAATRFNLTVLLVTLGVSLIVRALAQSGQVAKPYVDNTLD